MAFDLYPINYAVHAPNAPGFPLLTAPQPRLITHKLLSSFVAAKNYYGLVGRASMETFSHFQVSRVISDIRLFLPSVFQILL
jgi:hypothetical protein